MWLYLLIPRKTSAVLNELVSTDIDRIKGNAIEASNHLNADVEMAKLLEIYAHLLEFQDLRFTQCHGCCPEPTGTPNQDMPEILMVMLCMRCTIGGAEKQYSRVFEILSKVQENKHHLLINQSMLDLLKTAGLLSGFSNSLIILDPPFRKLSLSSRICRNQLYSPLLTVLDILWYCWQCWKTVPGLHSDVVHPLLTASTSVSGDADETATEVHAVCLQLPIQILSRQKDFRCSIGATLNVLPCSAAR